MTRVGARNIQGKIFEVGNKKKDRINSKQVKNEILFRSNIGNQWTKKSPTVGSEV